MPLLDVLPRCEAPLNTRPRELDAPLPLIVGGGCVLPRPRPREVVPRTDDIAVTVEAAQYWRHV